MRQGIVSWIGHNRNKAARKRSQRWKVRLDCQEIVKISLQRRLHRIFTLASIILIRGIEDVKILTKYQEHVEDSDSLSVHCSDIDEAIWLRNKLTAPMVGEITTKNYAITVSIERTMKRGDKPKPVPSHPNSRQKWAS